MYSNTHIVWERCRSESLDAAQTVAVSDDDLTGLDVPHEFGADGVQGAALAGKGPAGTIGQLADAQRAEAVGVAGGDQLAWGS